MSSVLDTSLSVLIACTFDLHTRHRRRNRHHHHRHLNISRCLEGQQSRPGSDFLHQSLILDHSKVSCKYLISASTKLLRAVGGVESALQAEGESEVAQDQEHCQNFHVLNYYNSKSHKAKS